MSATTTRAIKVGEQAKRIADKYITRGGSPVPKIKERRDGYFFCRECGKEEKIYDGAPADYVPATCVACGQPDIDRQKQFAKNIAQALEALIPAAKEVYEERKIEANEGRYTFEHLDEFRKTLENIDRISARLLKKEKRL